MLRREMSMIVYDQSSDRQRRPHRFVNLRNRGGVGGILKM
jgi:hypothetical protein